MALRAVAAARKNGAWPDVFLDNLIKKESPDRRDAALVTRIAFGTLQNRTLCDFYIDAYSSKPVEKLEPLIADILRISVYQILFMDKIPDSAAVNEGVELAKKHSNPGAAKFVNAVLRKIVQNRNNLPEIPNSDAAEYLAVKYSHPVWLVRLFIDELGADECEELLKCHNTPAPVYLQVNTLKTETDALRAELRESGIETEVSDNMPDCLIADSAGDLTALKAFHEGRFYVQDPAAKLASLAADLTPGSFVIDGCAAPGGKSFAAAIAMQGSGRIHSRDLHEKKLRLIVSGAERLGISIIDCAAGDARNISEEFYNSADTVFADVPCSGLGIIRKKPDIRFKEQADIKNLPAIQLDILRGLSRCVKSGGVLIYSTCTVNSAENSGVSDAFAAENPEFSYEGFTAGSFNVPSGKITLWPHRDSTDGFYIAKFRRK